jgi:hypothetical protein
MCQAVSATREGSGNATLPGSNGLLLPGVPTADEADDPCRGALAGACTRLFKAALIGAWGLCLERELAGFLLPGYQILSVSKAGPVGIMLCHAKECGFFLKAWGLLHPHFATGCLPG